MDFNWVCPHCQMAQTVVRTKSWDSFDPIDIKGLAEGLIGVASSAVGCSNPECLRVSVDVSVERGTWVNGFHRTEDPPLAHHRLIPESLAVPQPEYIPAAIREDYYEACRIRDLSPKASATLARRCLQGMIRDFCGISGKTLYAEIQSLKKQVDEGAAPRGVSHESVDGIDHVRSIGNIGAHMEAEVDRIISVDPDEAQLLIELIESLFEEWYVARQVRQDRLSKLAAAAEAKAAARLAPMDGPKNAPETGEISVNESGISGAD